MSTAIRSFININIRIPHNRVGVDQLFEFWDTPVKPLVKDYNDEVHENLFKKYTKRIVIVRDDYIYITFKINTKNIGAGSFYNDCKYLESKYPELIQTLSDSHKFDFNIDYSNFKDIYYKTDKEQFASDVFPVYEDEVKFVGERNHIEKLNRYLKYLKKSKSNKDPYFFMQKYREFISQNPRYGFFTHPVFTAQKQEKP